MILSVFVRLFRNVCSLKLLANGANNSRCSLFSLVQLNVMTEHQFQESIFSNHI